MIIAIPPDVDPGSQPLCGTAWIRVIRGNPEAVHSHPSVQAVLRNGGTLVFDNRTDACNIAASIHESYSSAVAGGLVAHPVRLGLPS